MKLGHSRALPNLGKRGRAIGVGAAVAVAATAIALLALGSCTANQEQESGGSAWPATESAATEAATDFPDTESKDSAEESSGKASQEPDGSATASDASPSSDAGQSTPSGKAESSSEQPAAAQTSGSGGNAASSEGSAEPAKRWVDDYTTVWVEDTAAWTEQVPIYGYEERSVCNVCGADISDNVSAHAKAHMLAGEGSGHHNEYIQVITGYETVTHAAEGHWETVVSGGHWE